jgi:hypothetical protein
MNFPNAIAIIVARPFSLGMTYSVVDTNDMVVTLAFIRVTHRGGQGETMNVRFQNFASCVRDDPQADLVTFTPNGAHNWRAIIGKCAMSALFIRPAARRIRWIGMKFPFFPPHSETFRPFQNVHPLMAFRAGLSRHSPGFHDAA